MSASKLKKPWKELVSQKGYLYFPAPSPLLGSWLWLWPLVSAPDPGPQFVFTGPGPRFVFIGRAHWLGFDLKVCSSIYLAYQLHCIFYL